MPQIAEPPRIENERKSLTSHIVGTNFPRAWEGMGACETASQQQVSNVVHCALQLKLQPAAFPTSGDSARNSLSFISQAVTETNVDARAIPPPRVYTQKDIARTYKIPKSTMYDEIKEGTFPEKLPGWGRAARWDVGEVEAWYAQRSGRQPWANNSRPFVTNLPDLTHEILAMSRGNEMVSRRYIERFEPE